MSRSLKIVHLETSLEEALKAEHALNKGKLFPEIKVVGTREQLKKTVIDFSPDIVLCEFSLPDIHCAQVGEVLKESNAYIPFIIVSSAISDEMALEILEIGADDYVIKDQIDRLPFAVLRSLEKHEFKNQQQHLLQQLSNSELRFRTLVENSADAVVVLNTEAVPTYVSSAVTNVLGYTPQEIFEMDIFTMAHPEDLEGLSNVMMKVLANPGVPVQGHTGRMLHKDGSWRWIEATVTNMLHEPAIRGIVDNFRDVTDKKASEAKLLHINRLYALLSQVNRALVHAPDQQTLFREVCRIACETGEFLAAWIELIDTNGKTRTAEASGVKREHLAQFNKAQNEVTAILKSQPFYVSNNTALIPFSGPWKEAAAVAGYKSYMVLPIKRSGVTVGCFNLFASETDFFTQAETNLLEEAAAGISFGLDYFEKERLKTESDNQLKHKEWRLSQAQAIAHLGSWETDLATATSFWSDEACRIYGLPENDNVQTGASWLTFVHPDDLDYVVKMNKHALESKQATAYYNRIIRKDGQIRYLHVQTHVEVDDQGKAISLYGALHDVSEIEKSQQALRNSEYNLRAIFENTSEGFILTDSHATIKYFNSKARYFYSLTIGKSIVLGNTLMDSINDEKREEFNQAIKDVLSGQVKQFEHAYGKIKEKKSWLSVTMTPVVENDLITGLTVNMTDITDRKMAQDLLQRSESNLNAIMNNTDALLYSLDTDLRYITYNHALESLMQERYGVKVQPGYDIRESLSRFDPGEAAYWEEINRRALGGEILKFEKELPYNGAYSCLKFSIHPIRKNNTVTGLSCFVNDITREKQADEKVLKALEEKNVILESIGDCFFAVDRNWTVAYWNKQAENILSCPKEKILGRYLWDVFPDVKDTLFDQYYRMAIEQNTIQHFESYYERDSAWFEVTAYPSASGLSVYLREITERKRAESQLLELNKNLQNYTEELIDSNKGLEQFSYIVSHNLRAPVANIIGLTGLLSQHKFSPTENEELLQGVLVNVRRLDDIVSDLNTILQVKREVSENKEPVQMQELVNNIRASIYNIIIQERVEIQTDFSAINNIFTLRSYLHSIFYNLIMNSVKYRQKDIDPVIRIKSEVNNGDIIILFQDNGMGIDLKKKGGQLFGLYKRFHHHVEGKGMGLFMVKTQVEMLGGKINVTSTVNEGTEFRILFRSTNF
ncbi:PAS domain S-box protein [Dyadobacter psychrophilus]|uniref:histidine kinase n=1 Tax=Dyadobacter psychrophilus TaxID=651661 RepID=A0A1T5E1H4_9BACT|nr:PAS domain S-box protein [Dyadobacter psychrophilus]SKB77724.1 PAS domain S-box-containing protein [Dyadobacter psychrophilus]